MKSNSQRKGQPVGQTSASKTRGPKGGSFPPSTPANSIQSSRNHESSTVTSHPACKAQPHREHKHRLGGEYKRWRLTVFQFFPFVFQSVLLLHGAGAARIKSALGRGPHEYVTGQKWAASLNVHHTAETNTCCFL